jgi:CDP-glucose 4,6-dehydratase
MQSTSFRPSTVFWKNRNVLVTGHTGFMGAWFSFWLHEMGAKVHGIALDPITSPNLFTDLSLPIASDLRMDIRDFSQIQKTINAVQPEFVFHLAAQALVLPSYELPVDTFATNVLGTAHILEACRQTKSIKSISVITSDKCYENNDQKKAFVESDPMGGKDPYSASKGAAELVIQSYRQSYFQKVGLPLLSFRAGNIIGGGDWSTPRLFPDMMRCFHAGDAFEIRNPNSTRPWQHVLEPLNVYLRLSELAISQSRFSDNWNIGPDETGEKSVLDVCKLASQAWNATTPASFFNANLEPSKEAIFLKISSQKLKDRTGWKPVLSFEESVNWSVDWYQRYYAGGSAQKLCREQIQTFLLKIV